MHKNSKSAFSTLKPQQTVRGSTAQTFFAIFWYHGGSKIPDGTTKKFDRYCEEVAIKRFDNCDPNSLPTQKNPPVFVFNQQENYDIDTGLPIQHDTNEKNCCGVNIQSGLCHNIKETYNPSEATIKTESTAIIISSMSKPQQMELESDISNKNRSIFDSPLFKFEKKKIEGGSTDFYNFCIQDAEQAKVPTLPSVRAKALHEIKIIDILKSGSKYVVEARGYYLSNEPGVFPLIVQKKYRTLDNFIASEKFRNWQTKLEVTDQLVMAVNNLHDQERNISEWEHKNSLVPKFIRKKFLSKKKRFICHGDLKMDNIFVDDSAKDMIKIGDFGEARIVDNFVDTD